jgi:hypothetical protein
MPHEVGPGNWLMLADQVQHNSAVDIASRFAGGHLKIVQINFTHERKKGIGIRSNFPP